MARTVWRGLINTAPPPVAHYLRRVLPDDPRPIASATLRQRGDLRARVASPRWLPFVGTEEITCDPPGFLWDARISAPFGLSALGVRLRVQDGYAAGWEGHFSRYVARAGMRVPTYGEVGWYDGPRWQPVWRGTLISARYHFATVRAPWTGAGGHP